MSSFSNSPATTEIYTLSLHDALPISAVGVHGPDHRGNGGAGHRPRPRQRGGRRDVDREEDRKSTRLNSSHLGISYAVFCLKKKKKKKKKKYNIKQTKTYNTNIKQSIE